MKSKLGRPRLGLTILAATLLSFYQTSYAQALSLTLSSGLVDFGPVPVGTSSTVTITALAGLDRGFASGPWIVAGLPSPFSDAIRTLLGNCTALVTCDVDVTFSPTTFGPASAFLNLTFTEFPLSGGAGMTDTIGTELMGTGVPGPIVGAGLPGLILACGILLTLARRRRQIAC